MRDASHQSHPVPDPQPGDLRRQPRPLRPFARDHQPYIGEHGHRLDYDVVPLARDQRADAGDQRPGDAKRGLCRHPVARCEAVEINPGAVDADLRRIHPQRDHIGAHRVRYREQSVGRRPRGHHLRARRTAAPPVMDIRAARLDRNRHAECPAQFDRSHAIGEKEACIDHVEGEVATNVMQQRLEPCRQQSGVETPLGRGKVQEARTPRLHAFPDLMDRQSGQGGITTNARQRRGGTPSGATSLSSTPG